MNQSKERRNKWAKSGYTESKVTNATLPRPQQKQKEFRLIEKADLAFVTMTWQSAQFYYELLKALCSMQSSLVLLSVPASSGAWRGKSCSRDRSSAQRDSHESAFWRCLLMSGCDITPASALTSQIRSWASKEYRNSSLD